MKTTHYFVSKDWVEYFKNDRENQYKELYDDVIQNKPKLYTMIPRTIIPDVKQTDKTPSQIAELIDNSITRALNGDISMAALQIHGAYYGGKSTFQTLATDLRNIEEEARKKAKEAIEKYINS